MNDRRDPAVAHALDALIPEPSFAGDWDAVAQDALARRSRRRWTQRAAAVAVAAVAAAGVVLAWPFAGDEPGGVLDRALAAVGDGPVLHVVLEGSWGGDVVDLQTGERRHVPGIDETWYDAERNLVRRMSRLGEHVQTDETYRPGTCTHPSGSTLCYGQPGDIAALGRRYRQALESGTARVVGDDVIEGVPVVWVRFHREHLPDVEDGKLHPWTQQVAVSKETYEPVATRETRDGAESPGTRQLVRTLEYLAADAAPFGDPDGNRGPFGMYFSSGLTGPELTLAEARDVLGRAPLWADREWNGLPLARIGREQMGRFDPKTRQRDGIEGAVFVYGRLAEAGPGDVRFEGPYAVVRETVESPIDVERGNLLVPPPGRAWLSGNHALVRRDGLYVRIEASSPDLALAAARALRPVDE